MAGSPTPSWRPLCLPSSPAFVTSIYMNSGAPHLRTPEGVVQITLWRWADLLGAASLPLLRVLHRLGKLPRDAQLAYDTAFAQHALLSLTSSPRLFLAEASWWAPPKILHVCRLYFFFLFSHTFSRVSFSFIFYYNLCSPYSLREGGRGSFSLIFAATFSSFYIFPPPSVVLFVLVFCPTGVLDFKNPLTCSEWPPPWAAGRVKLDREFWLITISRCSTPHRRALKAYMTEIKKPAMPSLHLIPPPVHVAFRGRKTVPTLPDML